MNGVPTPHNISAALERDMLLRNFGKVLSFIGVHTIVLPM